MATKTSTAEMRAQFGATRLLLDAGGLEILFADARLQDRRLLRALGLPRQVETAPTLCAVEKALTSRLKTQEVLATSLPRRTPFYKNLAWVCDSLGLEPLERRIVEFVALSVLNDALSRTLELFGPLRAGDVHHLLSVGLAATPEQIGSALAPTGRLMRSGLLWIAVESPWRWEAKIGLLHGLVEQLQLPHEDPALLLRSNFHRAPATELILGDFAHLGDELRVFRAIIAEASATGREGINLLIHGAAGTGKTSFARAVAADLGLEAFDVAHQDRFGNPLKAESRVAAMTLGQELLGSGANLLVLDEAEDLFGGTDSAGEDPRRPQGRVTKAHLNVLLEENRLVTIWIMNSIRGMDPAYLRRFSQVLHLPIPPSPTRERILDQALVGHVVPDGWVRRIAVPEVAPALLVRAVEVGVRAASQDSSRDTCQVVETVLNGHLAALGKPRLPSSQTRQSVSFRPDLINADTDIRIVLDGLRRTGYGRVLCHGLPGSGKSAFGRHVAEATGRPLILRRPSDLLGRYVGDTEGALAEAFATATRDGAVLQLDEIDGFLGRRDLAHQGWEVSMVNELLTQLESYEGLLVATTNRVEAHDEAALRRFDLKLHFQPPTRSQLVGMLETFLAAINMEPTAEEIGLVQDLHGITPGDFSLVLRQGNLNPITTALDFVNRLAMELRLKSGGTRKVVGFGGGA